MATVDFDCETWNNFFHQRRPLSEEEFHRHLEDTPVFTVPLENADNLWNLYKHDNLGELQFSVKTKNAETIGLLGTDTATRREFPSCGIVVYDDVFPNPHPDSNFTVRCPLVRLRSLSGKTGECQGFASMVPLAPGLNQDTDQDTDRDTDQDDEGCFSPLSTVELENGLIKQMQDLMIGDKVLVGPNKYKEIYSFGHKLLEEDTRDKAEFRKITVAGQDGGPTLSSVWNILLIT
mmetsp:Transcript_12092/g.33477  ORF Transcript_12092/g.33477 Transcript_12092/m.33477 type:complete len:234 (+) Transcript_12092:400-1101(+)